MKLPWLPIVLIALLGAACAAPTAAYCERDDQCPNDELCNLGSNTCFEVSGSDDSGSPDSDGRAPAEQGGATVADSLECAGDGQRCAGPIPEGWSGPLALAETKNGDAPPACQGDYDDELALVGATVHAEGACSCACGEATNLDCSAATLREWNGSDGECELGVCAANAVSCTGDSQSVAANACTTLSSALRSTGTVEMLPGNLIGGSCAGGPSTSNDLDEARFETQTRLCAATLPGEQSECGANGSCAAPAPDAFESGLCIVSEGEVECPANSGYSERLVRYHSIADGRSCDAGGCACATPTGSCGGSVDLMLNDGFGGTNCFSTAATLGASSSPAGNDNLCGASSNVQGATYHPDLDGRSCTALGASDVLGSAEAVAPVTICCQP